MFKAFVFLFLFSSTLFSHPHTFIDVYPSIKVKDGKTTEISFKWKLDEMTSSMLIYEFDQNGDGKIDSQENYYAYKNYFAVLEEVSYYTELLLDEVLQEPIAPKNFKVTIENNRVCYFFEIEGAYYVKKLSMEFGDRDFFVAMVLKPEFLNITGAKAKIDDIDRDFYFVHRLELKE